eukprot:scaffold4.g5012.t1
MERSCDPSAASEYDRSVNSFSPEGRIFQVEYAIEAIKLGSTAIAVRTDEGVVMAVEKRVTSPLLEPSSIEKVAEVDDHIGVAMSGLTAGESYERRRRCRIALLLRSDARTLIDHGRVETQQHRFTYNEPMPVESLTQSLCDLALRFGEDEEEGSMSRPFGVALLVAGWDAEHGPVLFHTDPSGTFVKYEAKAIGSGSEGAQTTLQARRARTPQPLACRPNHSRAQTTLQARRARAPQPLACRPNHSRAQTGSAPPGPPILVQLPLASSSRALSFFNPPMPQESYRKDLSLKEAEVLALSTLKQVMEEKVTATNVDIASVAPKWHLYTPAEVEEVIGRL